MTKRSKSLVQRAVVIVLCVFLSQSFHYSQTTNNEPRREFVKLRLSFELKTARQVKFSPASKLLAVQREDGLVQIIDITDGHLQTTLPLSDKAFYDMQWTSDGLRLLIADTRSVALWDARVGTRLSKPIELRRNKYFSLSEQVKLSPDEKLLLNVEQDESFKAEVFDNQKAIAKVWSIESNQLKFEIKINGPGGRARFNPNGKQILTTSEKDDAKLWDVATGRLSVTFKRAGAAWFNSPSYAEFSPDGRFVIQTEAGRISIWHSSSGALNTRVPSEDYSDSSLKGFTPDGRMFATIKKKYGWRALTLIELRDCQTGELRSTFTDKKWEGLPDQLLWSNDGRTVVAASDRKYNGRIWDVATGRLKGTFPMVLTYSRFPLNFGFKDRDELAIHPTLAVISAASNKFVRLWSSETGELLQTLDNTGGMGEWSADGKLLLTSTKDLRMAHVWDVVGPELQSKTP